MKKHLLLITIVLITAGLLAQNMWQNDGIPVRQGVNIEWSRASEPMDDGSVVYVWSDTRYGDRDLWAQKVDASGNLVWGSEAILVNGEINRQEDPVVIGVGGGDVVIAWVDFRNEDAGDVYAQKLDENGNLLWNAAGVPLCLAGEIQISLNIVSDEDGGAYVIWLDSRNPGGTDIYGTHILSSGSIAAGWDANGNAVVAESGDQNQHTFWEDGTGGAILAWHDKRDANDENIYMQRIASNGDLLWDAGGVLLAGGDNEQTKPKVSPDGTGNFIFSWRDRKDDNFGDIYAQRVDLNGNFLWANEVAVYAGAGIQRNPRMKQASDDGAIIAWEDGRNEVTEEYKDIYAQKLDVNGNLLWDLDAVEIVSALNDQINPRLSSDGSGGCWIVWEDGRFENHPDGDVYAQHLDSNGNPTLTANGEVICDENLFQFSPLIKKSGSDIFVVWGDLRSGSTGMYVQVLDSSGNAQLQAGGELIWFGLDGDALNYEMVQYGTKKIMLWEDTRFSSEGIQIYMQSMNDDATFDLVENGEPITQMTGYDQEQMDIHMEPGTDQIAVIWQENRSDQRKIFAQAVDQVATSLWDDNGLAISSADREQYKGQIAYDNGNYFAGWTDYNGDFINPVIKISGQKIDASGNLQWGSEGVEIADRTGDDVLTDVVGRYYIWQNESWPDYNIYAKLVDENGNTAPGWDDNGTLICGATGTQSEAHGIMTPNGLMIIWKDGRNGDQDIYAQLITEDGMTQWTDDGIPLVSEINDQAISNVIYNDGLIAVWEDFRTGSVYDIYMQKYNSNGTAQWAAGGQSVAVGGTNQESPYITTNGTEYMVFWEDKQTATNAALYGKMFFDDGTVYTGWGDGKTISNAIKNQLDPMAVSDDEYAYVIWSDTRSSGKTDIYNIYAQKVHYTYNSVEEEEIPMQNRYLRQNYPNPFKTDTSISFNINPNKFQNARVNIYNVKGQQVRTLPADNAQVNWNGKDTSGKTVSAGIYFYKLEAEGLKSEPRKMLLIK